MKKKLTIITLTYNQLEHSTKIYFESLYKHTNIDDFNLIIIDNASTDGTTDYLKERAEQYHNVKIIYNTENLGYSKGNNQGLDLFKENPTDYIGLFNNDILFTPNWLENSLKAFELDKKIGMASPRINRPKDKLNNNNYLNLYKKYLSKYKKDFTYNITPYFCCVLIKKEVFEKVGYLDEKFTPAFYEDDDYSFRTLYAGYKNGYINNAFILHNHQTTTSTLTNVVDLLKTNKQYFYDKHYLGKFIYEEKKESFFVKIMKNNS